MFDNSARQVLRSIVAKHGNDVCSDRRRCTALLKDACGAAYSRELNVLLSALNEGLPEELLQVSIGSPAPVWVARLAARLVDNLGLTDEAARWAVESWAIALRVATEDQIASAPPRADRNVPPSYMAGPAPVNVPPPGSSPGQREKVCPQCSQPAALGAPVCGQCGHQYRTQFVPAAAPQNAQSGPAPAPRPAPTIASLPAPAYCQACGAPLRSGGPYCSRCGSAVNQQGIWKWKSKAAVTTFLFGGPGKNGPTIPAEIAATKFHWGAFLLAPFWLCFHGLPFIGIPLWLFGFVPVLGPLIGLCIAIYVGIIGNRLAWHHRQYNSVDDFFAVETAWRKWGIGVTIAFLALLPFLAIIGAVLQAASMGSSPYRY